MPNPPALTYEVCGVPITAATPGGAARRLVELAAMGGRLEVHLCNAYTLSLVDADTDLRKALTTADLNLPDGSPVAWLGRRMGTGGPVRGPGLIGEVVRLGRAYNLRHFYFGAAPGVALRMAEKLEETYPGAITAGVESPPFGPITDHDLWRTAQVIQSSAAGIVWVGLGTPRQDYIVPRLARYLDIPVIAVGAGFDFWAGTVAEAPKWLHGSGLEWAHRLMVEPRRLWRRYLLGNPRFLISAFKHRVRASLARPRHS